MDDRSSPVDVDPFAESDEWIAALCRQLFRARRAEDAQAGEVTMFYLESYLCLTLRRHLRGRLAVWDGSRRWIDGLSAVETECPSLGRLRIRAEVTWVFGQGWYDDPFEFDLELCPHTGSFRSYTFRFGDHRPLAAKTMGSPVTTPPAEGWAFEFRRGRAESGAAAESFGDGGAST